MPEIAKVSHRHEAIMQYMVANPTAPLGEVAAAFGVTQPWLSCIIHSHAFKTKLRERQDALFGNIAATLTEKLEAVAHAALDNLHEHVLASNSNPAQNLEVADTVLKALGYGAKGAPTAAAPGAAQVNNFYISRDDLAQARMVIQSGPVQQLEVDIEPRSEGSAGGQVFEHAPTLPANN